MKKIKFAAFVFIPNGLLYWSHHYVINLNEQKPYLLLKKVTNSVNFNMYSICFKEENKNHVVS